MKYQGLIREDGQIELLGQIFKSPSYAAVAGIQNAGSHRKTVNGWSSWKYKGKTLKIIRAKYLEEKNKS